MEREREITQPTPFIIGYFTNAQSQDQTRSIWEIEFAEGANDDQWNFRITPAVGQCDCACK